MGSSASVRFLYATAAGRTILKGIQKTHLDRIAVWFLCSSLSRWIIPGYVRANQIPMEQFLMEKWGSFRDFFLREKQSISFDMEQSHLVSPCDGWLSVCPVEENQSFFLKGSHYRIEDLIRDEATARLFRGGQCLIFRLCASDYHHYHFFDDGRVEKSQYIEGELHSVQPIACETYPVFSRNRRVWSLMETDHFGPVVQTEIGALVVGGIANRISHGSFRRGAEKGHFDLSGSTICLFLQKDCIRLRPELQRRLETGQEARVTVGMWIGTRTES